MLRNFLRFFKKSSINRPKKKDLVLDLKQLREHDLSNLFHSLNLFIFHKKSSLEKGKPIELKDIQSIEQLLCDLQSLIYQGKEDNQNVANESSSYLIKLQDLIDLIQDLSASYEHTYKKRLDYKFEISHYFYELHSLQENVLDQGELLSSLSLSSNSSFRIIHNLIKNAFEHGKSELKLSIYLSDQLQITMHNKLHASKSSAKNCISSYKQRSKSHRAHGLQSIEHLTAELGGNFKYCAKNGVWTSCVSLPYEIDSNILGSSDSRKAA